MIKLCLYGSEQRKCMLEDFSRLDACPGLRRFFL